MYVNFKFTKKRFRNIITFVKPFSNFNVLADMKKVILAFLLFISCQISNAQLYFPPTSGNSWDTISPANLGWCQDKIDTLFDFLETNNTKAFIVLKDGKIAIEKYFGTFTVDSLWYWASAGKSLTSFVVGLAQQDGFVNINDSTSHYLGSGWTVCPPAKEGLITVLDQLRMTTGLNDLVADNSCTEDTCLEYLADASTRWAYHNAPYTLLDDVILNGTGQSLNLYLLNKVKTPTGMTGNFFPVNNDNVFFSVPRSMARYGLLILNHGNWDGNQIMTDTAYFNAMTNTSQNLNPSYGYLWWLNGKPSYMVPGLQISFPGPLMPHAPMDMIAALGKNGQFINVVPSQNLVLIRMGDIPGSSLVPFTFNDSIWERMEDVMCTGTNVADNTSIESEIKLFPNPAIQNVSFYSSKNENYLITNLLGEIIKSGITFQGENKIDLSEIKNGIYFWRIGNRSGKLVVSGK